MSDFDYKTILPNGKRREQVERKKNDSSPKQIFKKKIRKIFICRAMKFFFKKQTLIIISINNQCI